MRVARNRKYKWGLRHSLSDMDIDFLAVLRLCLDAENTSFDGILGYCVR